MARTRKAKKPLPPPVPGTGIGPTQESAEVPKPSPLAPPLPPPLPPPVFTAEKPIHLPPAPPPPPPKKDTQFVVVTRWSRDEEAVNKWKTNCLSMGCVTIAARDDGKTLPEFLLSQLNQHRDKSVVYLHYGVVLQEYPAIFDKKDVDFMGCAYNIDPRLFLTKPKTGSSRPNYSSPTCFDPYVFQPTGDIYYFGNTAGSRELLDAWHLSIAKNPGKDVHDILSLVFNLFRFYLPLTFVQLPSEYLSPIKNKDAVIRHTQPLPDREPPEMYSELTKVECASKGGKFYEYVFFDEAAQIETFRSYLDYTESNNFYQVVPYSSKYANKTVVETNEEQKKNEYRRQLLSAIRTFIKDTTGLNPVMKHQDIHLTNIFSKIKDYKNITIHTSAKEVTNKSVRFLIEGIKRNTDLLVKTPKIKVGGAKDYSFEFVVEEDLSEQEKQVHIKELYIPTVLWHLDRNQDVLFVPPGESGDLLKQKAQLKLDFVATNKSDNDRKPDFDVTKPMFFSASNRALRAVIAICKDETEISKVFGGSHQFLTQIRCFWVHVNDS